MNNNYLLIDEGFASGINDDILGKDEKTISHHVLPVIFDEIKIKEWKEIHSTRCSSREEMRGWIGEDHRNHQGNTLLWIGKSMGCVEIIDEIKNEEHCFNKYDKIALFFVDGHSKLLKEIFKIRYGKRRDFKRVDGTMDNFKVWNYYQRNGYPEGARFKGSDVQVFIDEYDNDPSAINHWTIVKHPTVLRGMAGACRWLKSNE